MHWRATLRPEVLELKNWPRVKPQNFRRKRLWQTGIFDHVVRNDFDLKDTLNYIAMNPVREGYGQYLNFIHTPECFCRGGPPWPPVRGNRIDFVKTHSSK